MKGSKKQSKGEDILKNNGIFQLYTLAGFFLIGLCLFNTQSWAVDMDCGRNVINLTPNVPYNGNTIGGPLSVSSYGCTSKNEGGPHSIHSIDTNFIHGDITATLSNLNGVDLDVFILKDRQCESNNCVDGNTSATYNRAPPGPHYIVVDGYSNPDITAQGPYTLTVNAVCSAPVNLTLGAPYRNTTIGAPSNASSYNCSDWSESGPEVVHSITTTMKGDLRAELSDLGGVDLDVFILSDCTKDSCLPGAYGDNAVTYSNAPPGTYYIVVDGFLGAAGSYTLTVTGPPKTLIFGYGEVRDGLNYEIAAQVDSYTSINDLGGGSYRISGNAYATLGQRTINFAFTDLTAEVSGTTFKITAGAAYSILEPVIDMSTIDTTNLKYTFGGIVFDSTGAKAAGWLTMPEGTMIGDGDYPDPYMMHNLNMPVTDSLDFRYTVPDISQWFFRADDLPIKFKPRSKIRFLPQKIEIGSSDIEYIDRSSLSDSPGGSFDVANDGYFKLSKWRVALDILASGIEAGFELNNTEAPEESYATLFPMDAVVTPRSGYLQVSGNHIVNGEFNDVDFVFMYKSTDCDNNTGIKLSTLFVNAPTAKIGEDGSIYADKDNVQLQDTAISWGKFSVTRNTNDPVEVYVPGFIAWAEIKDTDGDLVKDFNDQCPSTPKGTGVNSAGCGAAETADSPRNRVEDHFKARRNGKDFFSQMPGSGIYAGLNILGAQTLTAQIGGTILTYPLTKTLFHIRLGGITGVTDAGAVNTDTTIYSYDFSFSNFGLNYLDSSPGDTVVDGAVSLPWPSDFALDLKGISMCPCADLDKASIEQPTYERNLGYWDTDFTPLGIVFQGDVSSSSCALDNNNRTLYVSMTHPIRHFSENVGTLTPFHHTGQPGYLNDVNQEPSIKGKIDVLTSQLTFDGFTTFPEEIIFSPWDGSPRKDLNDLPPYSDEHHISYYGYFDVIGGVSLPHFGVSRMKVQIYRGDCPDGIHDPGANRTCGEAPPLSKCSNGKDPGMNALCGDSDDVDPQNDDVTSAVFVWDPDKPGTVKLYTEKKMEVAGITLYEYKYGLEYLQPTKENEQGIFHSYNPLLKIKYLLDIESSALITPQTVRLNYGFLADAAYYWALRDDKLRQNITDDHLNKYKKDYDNAVTDIGFWGRKTNYPIASASAAILVGILPPGKKLVDIVKKVRPENWGTYDLSKNPFPDIDFKMAKFAGSADFINNGEDWQEIYAETALKTKSFVNFDASFRMTRFLVNDGVSPPHLEVEFTAKDIMLNTLLKNSDALGQMKNPENPTGYLNAYAKLIELVVFIDPNQTVPLTGIEGSLVLSNVKFMEVGFSELGAGLGIGNNFYYYWGLANGVFGGNTLGGGILVGKTPNLGPLMKVDPDVAAMLSVPNVEGLYVRLDGSWSIFNAGCLFRINAGAGVGVWVLPAVGGKIKGYVFGKVACVVSARGDITLIALYDREFSFNGTGFVAGGLGFCEPESWSSVARVWEDDWCWTCVAYLTLQYVREWDVNYGTDCE